MSKFRDKPVSTAKMPGGIPYIIGNEAAERFSFYGMKTILVFFMTQYLMTKGGNADHMSGEQATSWFHLFSSAVYFTPIFGALLADIFWGKYKTILSLSVVYCLGHLALAMDDSRTGLALGLTLIAIGSGGIKPCVSAHVGDQFGEKNQALLPKIFSWFYFSINFGSFFSTLLTPWLLQHYGPHLAFGIPGVLMMLATIAFWMGRNDFVHIPASGTTFLKETFSKEGLAIMGRLTVIYAFIAMFWALFDQTGSSWVLQAEKMDMKFLGITWLPSQMQAINPILVLLLIPICNKWVYPAIDRVFKLTPLRKIGLGFFITVPSFLIPAYAEQLIAAGKTPSIMYQVISYLLITVAEVFVSITALEFSYTQAKNSMKSMVMALFFLSVSLGNLFTSAVNVFIQNADGTTKITGAEYYVFFAAMMLATALVYIPCAMWFKEKTYIQDSGSQGPIGESDGEADGAADGSESTSDELVPQPV
jgi:proton-dependent oligopeptide transporter, POT family